MKKHQMGIWLDSQEATIVKLGKGEPQVQKIDSAIDMGETKGGSRTSTPWGPQTGVSDNAMLERRKNASKDYFEEIMEAVEDAAELYIFGPGEIKKHLNKFLESDKNFKPQIVEVATADSMTENQLVAKVKEFFESQGKQQEA